jgi:cytochrome P450
MTRLEAVRATTPPGPRGSGLLGMLFGMAPELRRGQLDVYERVMLDHGDVVRIAAGPPGLRLVIYLVSHPDGVQQVLATEADRHSKDTPFYREIAAYAGDGLLTSDGATWRMQRRTVAPLFTPRRVARYVGVMAEEAERLADQWGETEGERGWVDLHTSMVEYTLRVVGRVLFGSSVDEAIPVIRESFPTVSAHVHRRGIAAFRPPRSWPLPAERRAVAAQQALYRVVEEIVERRRRSTEEGAEDLVTLLLAARDPDTGAPLTDQEIRDQILIFLLAGHETTSTALTFTCHLLGRHPEIQRRVHDEVDEVLAGRTPTTDDVPKLAYTTMVVKEAMRLYPPAYAIGRLATAGDRICGYDIPAGGIVLVSPWATHRRPDFWPDPHRFDPERFGPDAAAAQHKYAYLPFGGGPRICIGNHFAMSEAVAATAVLLSRYALRSQPTQPPLDTAITLRPGDTVRCELTERHPARP